MENILYPIEWAVTWVMVTCHRLLSIFMDPNSGWTWALAIVGLTIVVRILIFPLFMKQLKSSRAMQLAAPDLKAIQQKYKGKTDPESRQRMTQETFEVYREYGANPAGSCLPLLVQIPIFLSLFRVLFYKLPEHAAGGASYGENFGPLTPELADSAHDAILVGVATISDSFISGGTWAKVITTIMIALMVIVMYAMQKYLTMRNLPPSALEGPMGQTQKIMLYMMPAIFIISGPGMPIGVLVYWLTTNVWAFVQQWWMVHNNPTPGSPAEKDKHDRINAKRAKQGLPPQDFTPKKSRRVLEMEESQIRVQPKSSKGGKKLSDEERLKQAREARAKAIEERRAAQAKLQNSNQNGKKKKK